MDGIPVSSPTMSRHFSLSHTVFTPDSATKMLPEVTGLLEQFGTSRILS
jgi:hypothetical protein